MVKKLIIILQQLDVIPQRISAIMDNTEYETITEGLASMNYSKGEEVFYNKVQVLNRDLSIQVIKLFAEIRQQERNAVYEKKMLRYNAEVAKATNKADVKVPFKCFDGITVLDALAATGLRSVRYLKEIPGVNHVTINDLLPAATKAAAVNVERNGIDTSRVTINTGDACLFMYGHKEPLKQFDVIDLDPYGTAACFLDSAVQAVSDGGLLCVTCTDMSVFCGNYPEKCFALYGGVPLKAKYGHEMALRILLHTIDTTANKYKRHIEPWVSMSIDYYIRVFVRVHESPVEVKKSMCKRAMVHQSNLCSSYYLQPMGSMTMKKKELLYSPSVVTAPSTCPETGGRMKIGGPIWSYPIHKTDVLKELIGRLSCMVDTKSSTPAETIQVESCTASDVVVVPPAATAVRLLGLLTAMDEELADVPLHYYLPDMASQVHSKVPNMSLIHTALQNAGYRCSQFHHVPEGVYVYPYLCDFPCNIVYTCMQL